MTPPTTISEQTILILGGDGYLGWSLALALAHRTDWNIVIGDKLIKREWEKEVGAKLLVPLPSPAERIAEYGRLYGKSNLSFERVDLLDEKATVDFIRQHHPATIINAAQQPSAPFSMMSAKHAAETFSNNIISHLNVLFAIAEVDKSIKYIKLGSAGCYSNVDTDAVPLEKIDMTFTDNGMMRTVIKSWIPMHATDFYHQSKIADFLINDLCAELWKLRIITVQQSTIFGATIPENESADTYSLATRFNYDEIFSTVINRFVCQTAIGHPLTVYGAGNQRTGLVSLSDTIDNFLNMIELDVQPGQHAVIHNYTHRMAICEIAEVIRKLRPTVGVMFLTNPRCESESGRTKEFSIHPSVVASHEGKQEKMRRELEKMVEFAEAYRNNIDPTIIMPKVHWAK